jgi:PAS domain S-box-containing protein
MKNTGFPIIDNNGMMANKEAGQSHQDPGTGFLKHLTIAFGLLAILTALLGLIGLYFRITLLSSIFPGYKTIAFSATLIWIFFGSVLVINAVHPFQKRFSFVVSAILAVTGIVTAIEIPFNFLGDHFIVETWAIRAGTVLFGSSSSPISPIAAILIVSAAAALFCLVNYPIRGLKNNRIKDAVAVTAIFISLIALTFIISYIYGDPLLYGSQVIPIAAVSAAAAFCIGSGLLAASGPSAFPVRYLTGDSTRSRLLRIFIPLTAIIILVENVIFFEISSLLAISDAILLSATLVLFILVTTLLVARISGSLGRSLDLAEQALVKKNDDLSAMNEELMAIEEELRQNVDQLTKTEKELGESNERLHLAQDASGAGIWDWNITRGTLTWDLKMFGLFGLDNRKDTASFETWNAILHPDDLAEAHIRIERALQDHTDLDSQYRIIRPDKGIRWINARGRGFYDDSGKPIRMSGICFDVTWRRKAESDLLESEQRYRELVENADSAIIRMDTGGKISFFNEYAQKFFGYSAEEILGRDVRILVTPTESTGRRPGEMVNDILKNPDNFSENENENIKKNGERVWILWRNKAIRDPLGNIVGNLAIGQDITGRKRVEDALREIEQRFRLALKNAPVSVAIQDVNLVFLWAYNQRTTQPEEMIGKTDSDIFTPEDATRLIKLKRNVLESGKEAHEQLWLTMDGKRVYLDLYLEPLRNTTGQITGIGTATVDQTLEKLTEIALRDNEKRLREANDLLEAVTDATKVIIAAEDTNFRYTYFNKTYAAIIRRLTGKEIMTGMSMIDLFSDLPEEQRSELDEWSKVLKGQSVNDRIKLDDPKKGYAIYNVLHVPLRDAKWEIVGAGEIAFDVTSQVQVEETLRETSQYLTNLIDYADAPIIVWDPQFRITLFNHAFEHLTGRKAKEIIGEHLEILLPVNYLTTAMDLIKKTSEGERWESVEIPILNKEGGIRTVLWNSASIFGSDGKTIVATIAQGQDITDRKKIESEYKYKASEYAKMNVMLKEEIGNREAAETNLKKTLSLLNASFESTADGILVVDREGRITGYNQNFMNMWNIPMDMEKTRDNLTLTNYFQTQVKDPEKFFLDMKDLLAHPIRESYDVIELTDGRIFERYSKPQKIGKSAVGRVWSYRDITDRRRSEEKLVASLQEKEVLLREIHHRVKNNLQLVTGLLDMTRMRTRDEATTSILTDMMLKIQTMAQIHTRLYESKQFGKIGLTGQFRDQVVALSNIYSYKGHEIYCEIKSEEIFLPVDKALPCALVVNEILSNSYKHAFKGKTHGSIEISAVQEKGKVRIMVRDDGSGMPADFDISHANSLGLKLIRTLVQHQLKGSLTINSLRGTETIIEFPITITGT